MKWIVRGRVFRYTPDNGLQRMKGHLFLIFYFDRPPCPAPAENPDARIVLDMTRNRIDLFRNYSDYYGNQVFLLRKCQECKQILVLKNQDNV